MATQNQAVKDSFRMETFVFQWMLYIYCLPNETADGKNFAVEHTSQPKQSNLIVPPVTVTLKEDRNATHEEHQAVSHHGSGYYSN